MYKLTDNAKSETNQTIIRLSDGASIPHTDKNNFPVYLDWLVAGNTPLPADEPPVVYLITPQQTLVAVGGIVTITVTGAPDTTETITIDGIEQDVILDDDGRAEIVQTCESAGIIYIRDAHGNIVKVEVA